MNQKIEQLTAADFEEAINFMNLSFGTTGIPHDFARYLPALYQPTDRDMGYQFALRRDGRICAMAGLFPIVLCIADREIRIAGIGGVSTHPEFRGEGLMTVLMRHCVALMRQQGYPMSYLGGQRQRYLYFGFERCGRELSFTVSKANVRHHFNNSSGISFEPIEAGDERIATISLMHAKQLVHCERAPDKEYHALIGWKRRPYAATDEDGRMVGYLVAANESNQVVELVAIDDETAEKMISVWIERQKSDDIVFNFQPAQHDLVRRVARFCEESNTEASGNWQIFDWALVCDALMQLRRLSGPMLSGSVVVAIDDRIHLRLEADRDACRCTVTEGPADVQLDAATAMRVLFGPLAASQTVELPTSAAVLDHWCPLPLYLPRQDKV